MSGSFKGSAGARAHLQEMLAWGPDSEASSVGVLAHEVDGDEASRTWGRAKPGGSGRWALLYHNALGPILALVLVTGAGLQQDHGPGVLTVEPTGRAEEGRGERTAEGEGGETPGHSGQAAAWGEGGMKGKGTGSSPASDGRPAPL